MPPLSDPKKKQSQSSLKLWPEQQVVYKFAISREETAMFCEQRTGKTFVTMAILRKLSGAASETSTGDGNDFCGLLVSLLSNRDSTWLDNLQTHLKGLNVTSDWEEFKKLPSPKLLLIHYEMLPKLINKLVRYKKLNWACVDEAQRIAARGNQASRAMNRLSWIENKLVLTGTPFEKYLTDIFGVFRFLCPEVFGKNWSEFEETYMEWPLIDFTHAPRGSALWQQKILQQRILKNKATFREEMREQYMSLISPYCVRLTKADVGIIPPKVTKVPIPMSPHQREVYSSMKDNSFAHLRGGSRVLAPLAITNIMKQRQIATGFVYDDDQELHILGRHKLKHTLELVEQLPKPVVIFTAFRPENDAVTRALRRKGWDVAQVNGQNPRKKSDRAQIWRDFQRAQYDVAVVQIKTGGTGVDLWKASHAIVYSMGHSFRDWDQALSRLDNKQKKKASEFLVLCTRNSIDEALFDLVIVKKYTSEEVLSKLKKGILPCQKSKRPRTKQAKKMKHRKPRANRNTP